MKIKCLRCNEIIESRHRHNLVTCKCENCYIDGGQDYLHFGGKDFSKILIIFDDDTEIIANDESIYREEYSEWEKKKFKEEYNERYTKTAFQKLINEKKDLN